MLIFFTMTNKVGKKMYYSCIHRRCLLFLQTDQLIDLLFIPGLVSAVSPLQLVMSWTEMREIVLQG